MKTKLCIFLLAASLAAYGQGRSGSSGGHMGGPPSGAGSMGTGSMGSGSMDSGHDTMGTSHGHESGNMGNASRSSDMGKQSPDAVLSTNSKLSSKLESLLPKDTSAQDACKGFKNLGQCVAAIHVAHNLNIPFDDLKAKMTGTNTESLGKAIHQLKPEANAKSEAKKGEKQADQDLKESS